MRLCYHLWNSSKVNEFYIALLGVTNQNLYCMWNIFQYFGKKHSKLVEACTPFPLLRKLLINKLRSRVCTKSCTSSHTDTHQKKAKSASNVFSGNTFIFIIPHKQYFYHHLDRLISVSWRWKEDMCSFSFRKKPLHN